MKKIVKVFSCLSLAIFCLSLGLAAEEYLIGPQDILEIVVWKEESLTKVYTVDKAGFISMPYLKEIKVSGLSAKEVADLITRRLKEEGYLVNPVVTVALKEYRSQKIMLFGLVKNPGEYYLKGMTMVLDLLHQIGYAENEGGKMVIARQDPSSGREETINVDLHALLLNGDISQNIPILAGDSIIISPLGAHPLDSQGWEEYVVGPDDVLDIVTWKDDNLTKTVIVDKDGEITLPYLNKVAVAGLSATGIADLISQRLKDEGYLVNPVVMVKIKEYRSQKIMVFGTVKKPGGYYLKDKTMVLDLLSQINYDEKESGKMVIVRKDPLAGEKNINVDLRALLANGDLSQNIEILGGDKVILSRISSGQQIYILGEVRNPGPYTVERDMSVLEALRLAGGLTDFAHKGKIKIVREENSRKRNIIVNLNRIRKGDKSQDVTLQAGDVLVALKSLF